MLDLFKLRGEAETIVRQAGDILLSYFGNSLSCKDKAGAGFVTEADLAAEKFLIDKLSKVLPEAAFFAEESGINGDGDYCWVIDPLDGTTNFAHKIPYFCISVALTYKQEPILAVIYQPILKEMFTALKNKGAFLNDNPIKISNVTDFGRSFLVIGIPYETNEDYYKRFLEDISKIMKSAYAFRHFGAAALDLAYVACGRFDAIFFEDLSWWDFAAGMLMIHEAGGITSDFANKPILSTSRSFVGANKDMHGILLQLLSSGGPLAT